MVTISDKEAELILDLREDHFAELKAIEVVPGRLTKPMSAFANADGGDLYLGIDETEAGRARAWRRLPMSKAANGHLQAFEALFPLDQWVEYQFLELDGQPELGLVLKASIKKTPDIRRASDGLPYV